MSTTTQQDPDNRKHRRFNVDVEATVKTTAGQRVRARARDVSLTGICLVGDEAVASTQELAVDLVLAFGNNAYSEPLSLRARVVWCTPIAGSFQIGAMFEDVTDEQENFLEMFLQFLDGTLSPRGSHAIGTVEEDEDPEDPNAKDDPFR